MNALASSASPKGLKDCRKQQKCMIAELFLCRRRTKSTLPTLRRYALWKTTIKKSMQTVYNKLQTTGYTFKNKNVKFDFLQVSLSNYFWISENLGLYIKLFFTKLWRSHGIWSIVLLVHSLCNFISIRHTVHQIWMQEEEWQPFGAS